MRADLPHQALAMLRTAGRWPEALAFAQAHLPEQVCSLCTHMLCCLLCLDGCLPEMASPALRLPDSFAHSFPFSLFLGRALISVRAHVCLCALVCKRYARKWYMRTCAALLPSCLLSYLAIPPLSMLAHLRLPQFLHVLATSMYTQHFFAPLRHIMALLQAEGVELESRVAEPGVLSIAGRALLQEAHAALAESDGLAAAQAFLRISRQDSANDALLQQVRLPHL